MRIIGGKHKGIRLSPPRDLPVRPTTDMAKEALFNILEHRVRWDEITALDLFSGTGGISLELASRGTSKVISVDKNYKCVQFLKDTASKLELHQISVIRSDVFKYLERACEVPLDLIFADPPYDMELLPKIPEMVFDKALLAPDGILVLEYPSTLRLHDKPSPNELRKYGNSSFAIYQNKA